MAIQIHIPTPLRQFTENQSSLSVDGTTVKETLSVLINQHPKLKSHLYNEQGVLRSFVNVYKNDEDIRYLDGENTPIADGDEITIVPSVAGGA